MSGCPLPVIINSGSGNQGITSSVPVVIYCREMKYPEEKLYRALVFSNLITIHLKTGIGPLSAFCGVVCASCSAGAAVIYLETHDYDKISMSISNVLASVTGLSCDGAKPSCGSKIAACLDAAFVAGRLAIEGKAYKGREGIIRDTVEETISAIGHIGSDGMKDMDRTILEIMLG